MESFITETFQYDGSGSKQVLKRLQFLMFKSREMVESDALKQCNDMKAMLYAEREVHNTKNIELERCKRDYLNLEANFKVMQLERARFSDEHNMLKTSSRKLELDIAKIRKAIGDMRMREILEAK